jgi:hypothetical protein
MEIIRDYEACLMQLCLNYVKVAKILDASKFQVLYLHFCC